MLFLIFVGSSCCFSKIFASIVSLLPLPPASGLRVSSTLNVCWMEEAQSRWLSDEEDAADPPPPAAAAAAAAAPQSKGKRRRIDSEGVDQDDVKGGSASTSASTAVVAEPEFECMICMDGTLG